jgi:hypothetical protein
MLLDIPGGAFSREMTGLEDRSRELPGLSADYYRSSRPEADAVDYFRTQAGEL